MLPVVAPAENDPAPRLQCRGGQLALPRVTGMQRMADGLPGACAGVAPPGVLEAASLHAYLDCACPRPCTLAPVKDAHSLAS